MQNRLNSSQTRMISEQLEKYGIDSPDLRAELTDHYAERIEIEMCEGNDFEGAFAAFKADNSWLKLRKLQHQHEEIHTKSFLIFLKGFIRDMFVGRLFWVTYPSLCALYFIINLPFGSGEVFLYTLQIVSITIAAYLIFQISLSSRRKLGHFQKVLNLAFIQLYIGAYLPMVGIIPVGHPVFEGFTLATEANLLFYGFWLFSLIFTIKSSQRSERFRRNFLRA